MERGDGKTSKSQRSLEIYPSPCSRLHDNIGTLILKKKDEIETKFDKALGTIQCFLDPTCKEIARRSLTSKDVWKTLKDQLEGQESYTKIHLLALLYTTKPEEGSLDVDGYVKSMEAI
jgi:hypothetical protein